MCLEIKSIIKYFIIFKIILVFFNISEKRISSVETNDIEDASIQISRMLSLGGCIEALDYRIMIQMWRNQKRFWFTEGEFQLSKLQNINIRRAASDSCDLIGTDVIRLKKPPTQAISGLGSLHRAGFRADRMFEKSTKSVHRKPIRCAFGRGSI